jgi:signal transduction histidine kinase
LGKEVTALDSIEAASWSRRFLVDGFNSQGRIVATAGWLRGLSRRREIDLELGQLNIARAGRSAVLVNALWRWSAGLLLVGGLAFVWWLQRRARARRREVEELRQRIASDLHDEIGSNLGSIALLSRMALRQSNDARTDLEEINRVARETAASMRDIVWLIRPGVTGAQDFVLKLRETAATMLAGLEWQFDGEALTAPLSLEWKRELLLIFKEALHNIRRHAHAHRVTIQIADAGGEFVLRISDDGVGFDAAAVTTGHGLASQRQRAAALGAQWQIDSAPGQGTQIILRMKLPSPSRSPHP